ncbi:phosphotransferase enzyme family protein [Thalassotalea ganghwensis]
MSIATAQPLLSSVLANYNCCIDDCSVSPLGKGLINTTYLVSCPTNKLVLQKINHHVFTKPDDVVNNAKLIAKHLQKKYQQGAYALIPLEQVANQNQQLLTEQQGYWRVLAYIKNCRTHEFVETAKQAEQVAAAFAQFTNALGDFDPQKLNIIIKDFHRLDFRLEQLKSAIQVNFDGRLSSCQQLVDFCLAQRAFIAEVADLEASLPLRVTHNDTKINNLLFSASTNEPVAVIDLDTCMPGLVMHDFGDMVRTCCSNLPEDGKQIERMKIRTDILSALAKGYISELKDTLTEQEQSSLVVGALLLPYMIGIRFLTDYLNGDSYFKTNYAEHNFVRANNQLQMYKLLEQMRTKITQNINSF